MLSLNVPVPGQVSRIAADLHPRLAGFDAVRDDHTLVLSRLGAAESEPASAVEKRVRAAVAGTAPFDARVGKVGVFERPVAGPGPVVYLAVESPDLEALHRELASTFGAAEDLEGEAYVPHVTLARGGSVEDARALEGTTVGPVEWTVEELVFRAGGAGGERAGRIRLEG